MVLTEAERIYDAQAAFRNRRCDKIGQALAVTIGKPQTDTEREERCELIKDALLVDSNNQYELNTTE